MNTATYSGTLGLRDIDSARDVGLALDRAPEPAEEEAGVSINIIPRGISQAEIIYVTNQLAIMVDTGITLSSALEAIASQEENPTLKTLLRELKVKVEGGEDFSKALANHPDHFDSTFVAMVRASEQTGSLGPMLERIGEYLRKELETRGKVLAALAYPGVMLLLAIGVTIFLLTYVLPKFEPLFTRKGVALPTPTLVLMSMSTALLDYWWAWLIGGVAAIVAGYFFAKSETGRELIDWCKINMPIFGGMFRKVAISRSVRTLGTMVASGVSVLEALRLSAEVAGNVHYSRLWTGVLERVTTGSTMMDSLKGNELIPATLVQMIGAGEETGKIDYVLTKVSDYYDQEVELALKTATSLIEPLMITVMGFVVGGIGMALLMPIFKLSGTPG